MSSEVWQYVYVVVCYPSLPAFRALVRRVEPQIGRATAGTVDKAVAEMCPEVCPRAVGCRCMAAAGSDARRRHGRAHIELESAQRRWEDRRRRKTEDETRRSEILKR